MNYVGQVVIAYDNGAGRRGCIAGWAHQITQAWDYRTGSSTEIDWLPGSPKVFTTQQPDWDVVPRPPESLSPLPLALEATP